MSWADAFFLSEVRGKEESETEAEKMKNRQWFV
jgi:hypothetical protein